MPSRCPATVPCLCRGAGCALVHRLPGPISGLSFSWPTGEYLLYKDQTKGWATVDRKGRPGAMALPDDVYPCGPTWVDDWSLLALSPGPAAPAAPHVQLVWADPFLEGARMPSRCPTRHPIAEVLALSASHTRVAVITRPSETWLSPLADTSHSCLQIFSLMRGPNEPPRLGQPEMTLDLPHLVVAPVGDAAGRMWAPQGPHEHILSLAMRGEQVTLWLVDTQLDRRRRAPVMQLTTGAPLSEDVITRFTPDGDFFAVAGPALGAQPSQDRQLGSVNVYRTSDGACIFDYCKPISFIPRTLQELVAAPRFGHLVWQLGNELVVYDQSGRQQVIDAALDQASGEDGPEGFRDPPRPAVPLTLYDLSSRSATSDTTESSPEGSPRHQKLWCQAHTF